MALITRPDGCRLSFETHGRPGAPELLLLEGLGGDILGWRRNIPTLATECRVLAYDHRGNGNSGDPAGPVDMGTFVEDAIAVLEACEVQHAYLYGQSFGGMVALETALTHPDRVCGLVLAATHAGAANAVPVRDRVVPKGEPWRSLYASGFPDEHPEHVREDLAVGGRGMQHKAGERRQWEAMQGWDAFDRLGDIAVPTLVLHGSEDRLVAPDNARVLAERIPGAELHWLEGAGHLYHSEQAAPADAAVLDFIARHP
ncbi:MAG: alpha/beta fold hydrolase [Actinomycetota bacterium]